MELFERLELSFLSLPRIQISTSIIAPDGTKSVQSSFEGFNCPIEWVTALRAMAAAAKNTHITDRQATSSPAPTTSSPSQDAPHSHPSLVHRSDRKRGAPATRTRTSYPSPNDLQTRISYPSPNDLQTTGPGPDLIYNHSSPFPDESNESVTNRPPSSPGTPFDVDVDVGRASSPAHMIDAGRQSPLDVTSQSAGRSTEQSLMSPNTAGDTEVNSPQIDNSATTATPFAMVKRTQKLEAQLEAIRDSDIPDRDEFNDTVRRLYRHSSASSQPVNSMEQLGLLLGRLGNISSAVGIIYSLLSWEIFRWEEDRLVRDEGRALLVAAKQVR